MRVAHNKTPIETEQRVCNLYLAYHKPKEISTLLKISKSSIDKILRRNGIERILKTPDAADATDKKCSKCLTIKDVGQFHSRRNTKYDKYSSWCIACSKLYKTEYDKEHADQKRKRNRVWAKLARKTNPQYKIAQNLRRRVREVIKIQNASKSGHLLEMLGCSLPELLYRIESQFQSGMSWENYGEWHIDHVRPCSSFDLTDLKQQAECFRHSNLQPLWAKDNLAKSDNV
jgi:hypothetical protein